jgi:hypothetical protein
MIVGVDMATGKDITVVDVDTPSSPEPRAISESLVEQVKVFLTKGGVEFFRWCKEKHGDVAPVFKMKDHLDYKESPSDSPGARMAGETPHPVHFREGMQVRNFMRTCEECKGWSDHDFDNMWKEVVELAIKE